ncbi:MAG TPA: class I SAM-dependent methyltransferase [Candidatus Paceibacterota bacterium]|nr:class I SAM-dependent methyltransferase [Candidatus Paceibacterota bacterium]
MKRIQLTTVPTDDYELLDSGAEEKLERYGKYILARPDPQALWEKKLSVSDWSRAHARYERTGREGKWKVNKDLPKEWEISFGNLNFLIKPTSFKHTGLFPEQLPNWHWMREILKHSAQAKVLNLFAYTGGATLTCALESALVTHVDASKTAVAWAKENAERSKLSEIPIKWMVEDVLKFVKREINRGNKYDAIIMDPPAFGHGPKDELWKIERDLLDLLHMSMQLLSEKPLFVLVNGYAAGYSPLVFAYNLEMFKEKFGGDIEFGDLTIEESGSGRLLPCGIFARWATPGH